MRFDPVAICRILNDEGVDDVVVGGFAAAIQGSPLPREDVDVLPSRDAENLERLASALRRLRAKLRTEGDLLELLVCRAYLRMRLTALS